MYCIPDCNTLRLLSSFCHLPCIYGCYLLLYQWWEFFSCWLSFGSKQFFIIEDNFTKHVFVSPLSAKKLYFFYWASLLRNYFILFNIRNLQVIINLFYLSCVMLFYSSLLVNCNNIFRSTESSLLRLHLILPCIVMWYFINSWSSKFT